MTRVSAYRVLVPKSGPHINPLKSVSGDMSACVRWLHVNLVLSRSVSLLEEQLRQLSHAVGDDAVRSSIAVAWTRVPAPTLTLRVCCGRVDDRRWRTRR